MDRELELLSRREHAEGIPDDESVEVSIFDRHERQGGEETFSTTLRIHRDIFPRTDHGYTWVEFIWFERGESTLSPIIPVAGCCERLGNMPGGPVICDMAREQELYAPLGVIHTKKSEQVHDEHFYRVGVACITPIGD